MITLNGSSGSRNGKAPRWWQIWKHGANADLLPYRRLALQLHHGMPRDAGARSVLLATPDDPRICAHSCVALVSCMAEEIQRPVLLVDAAADSDSTRILGGETSPGLSDFLADPMRPLQDLVLPTSRQNVWFLSRGSKSGPPPASPENAHDLLVRAAKQWDFIIVAGGAVLRNPLALAMAPHTGRVLLLVMENRTHLDDIDAARHALELCRARDVSLLLTQPHR